MTLSPTIPMHRPWCGIYVTPRMGSEFIPAGVDASHIQYFLKNDRSGLVYVIDSGASSINPDKWVSADRLNFQFKADIPGQKRPYVVINFNQFRELKTRIALRTIAPPLEMIYGPQASWVQLQDSKAEEIIRRGDEINRLCYLILQNSPHMSKRDAREYQRLRCIDHRSLITIPVFDTDSPSERSFCQQLERLEQERFERTSKDPILTSTPTLFLDFHDSATAEKVDAIHREIDGKIQSLVDERMQNRVYHQCGGRMPWSWKVDEAHQKRILERLKQHFSKVERFQGIMVVYKGEINETPNRTEPGLKDCVKLPFLG